MPLVSATGHRPTTAVNVFWIAANIMFDLETGKTKEILLLANKIEDATIFSEQDAQNYLNFVSQRAKKIQWSIDRPALVDLQQPQRFVIKGVQYV